MDYLRPLWQCMQTFCSCFHCSEELGNQGYESNERTHLLPDTVHSSPALRRSNSDTISNEYAQSLPKKDDQNALCRLVQNTAINMIDVGAMDAHNLEHQEYTDRIKLYSQRLQQQWSKVHHPSLTTTGLLRDMPNSAALSIMPAVEDLQQMRVFLQKAHTAIADIKIEHKEAVVVPFRIP